MKRRLATILRRLADNREQTTGRSHARTHALADRLTFGRRARRSRGE
jgi:hypothetical protein